ncbi:hypothetical protein DPMN_016774 [Dreissena polymorpha]|uniref:Uncharacterized protein n=1 Tax=Dreissena polymorpha TaxID=45954 RepID=A0A9D4S5T3_DREPO|nr:hypothetical protein DPMN_016774 [Dreissena polymorpha]
MKGAIPVTVASMDLMLQGELMLPGRKSPNGPLIVHGHRHNLKNRFELIRTLGEGTYGKVKLAVERSTCEQGSNSGPPLCKTDTIFMSPLWPVILVILL